MKNPVKPNKNKTLLVFSCHEAWVYQLACLDYQLDIIVGLKGQYKKTWDRQMRPIPENARLISLPQAIESKTNYDCIIAHNIADLLDIKSRPEPRLIVIHSTLEGRLIEEKTPVKAQDMKTTLQQYLQLTGTHAVAVSSLKGNSWALTEDIVPFSADPEVYPLYSGHLKSGLRICNFIQNRKKILLWDLHEKAFASIPIQLVGHNPDIPTVKAAENWEQLKQLLQSHRFYVHTADPQLEDGYNMATLEAMAAGMPILGNKHPGSPVEHGVSGFLSDDPNELAEYASQLLNDRQLAMKMGRHAQIKVAEHFAPDIFKAGFIKSIETARQKWKNKLRYR